MSYGDLEQQLRTRGAAAIARSASEKVTRFAFEGARWLCPDRNRSSMASELADGYEMPYCLRLYCVAEPQSSLETKETGELAVQPVPSPYI